MRRALTPQSFVPAASGVAACQDCGAAISGNYCANCGQETLIETPTVRQFAHELMDQYVAVEGKLGRTLRVLLTQPGQLTIDYIQGRRQRYVRPLKLYVSISVVFFGLLGILPDSIGNPFMKVDPAKTQEQPAAPPAAPAGDAGKAPAGDAGKVDAAAGDTGTAASGSDSAAAPAAKLQLDTAQNNQDSDLGQRIRQDIDADLKKDRDDNPDQAIRRDVDAEVDKHRIAADGHRLAMAIQHDVDAEVDKNVHRSRKDRQLAALSSPDQRRELREKLADDAPYAMFVLLPYFALLLSWLFRKNRQRYGVHLLFTVHLHCFFFILLMPMFLPFSPLRKALELAGVLYTFVALRRVYGGGWARILWRMSALAFFDFLAISATALSGVMSAVLGGGA